jgi:4-carboxymuconolactone decarboxylase
MSRAGARLAKLAPESLDADQRAVYQSITGGPRATGPRLFDLVDEEGRLEGPFNAFLLQPHLGGPLQELGAAVRYATNLSDRAREIAILVVSEHWDSAFERYAHEAVARQVGLSDAELADLRAGQHARLPADDALVAETTQLLVSGGDLDDRAYAEAIAGLGEAGLFELLTLVGYYSTLALQLRVFRVPAPTLPP